MPSQGIILLAWGKRGYGFMAYNLALSIKHFHSDVLITLYADRECLKQVADLSVFDDIRYIDAPISDPGRFKVSIYDKLPYDNNLYLDVDTLCLQPIKPLLEKLSVGQQYYATFIHDTYDVHSPNEFPLMYWANKDVIWNHYKFTKEVLPATQSSIQFIRKCDQSKRLFEKIEAAFDNPIPIDQLKHHWGGTQPDELYLNVALAQEGIAPHIGDNVMWFGDNGLKRPFQVASEYYFLSYYGNKQKVKPAFWEYYDQRIKGMAQARNGKGFTSGDIKPDKHANGGMQRLAVRRSVKDKTRIKQPFITPVIQIEKEKKAGSVFLYTSFYDAGNSYRNAELERCMRANIDNPFIDKVINLGSKHYNHDKVLNLNYPRPTYSDYVKVANGLKADYSVIANSDIYFDASLELIKDYLTENDCFALSRYDIDKRNTPILFNYDYSQDSWIFKGEIKPVQDIDFIQGLPACDNRFAYELNRAGYRVLNPALSIVTYHVHQSNVRTYKEKDRLKGEVMNIPLTSLQKMQDITIVQPGKVGDIIIVLPIAKHYHDLGHKVYWVCPEKYHDLFSYVNYATPVLEAVKGSKVIDLSFGLNTGSAVHREWLKRKSKLDSFITLKYEIAGVPIEKLRTLEYERNLQKEIEVWDMVYPRDNYILVHGNSDYGTAVDFDSDLTVEFSPIEGYTIFDWRKVIENASEIHCIDSSLVNFVDNLQVTGKLFYYITDKVPQQADRVILKHNWETVNKLEYANS